VTTPFFFLPIFALMLGLALAMWFVKRGLDRDRIRTYIEQRGGKILSIRWTPFGKGWFGEKSDRIYEVVYRDHAGNEHFATCKTSMWTGVYWTEDRVTHRAADWHDPVAPGDSGPEPFLTDHADAEAVGMFEEMRRLREENARLKRELGRRNADADERIREP
jgi:hypothetical protein